MVTRNSQSLRMLKSATQVQFQVEGESDFTAVVFDAAGSRIGGSMRSVAGWVTLPAQGLSEGIYAVRITTQRGSLMQKFVVEP